MPRVRTYSRTGLEVGVVEGCNQPFSVFSTSQHFAALIKFNQSKDCQIENEKEIGGQLYFPNGTVVPYRFVPDYTDAELFH